MITYGITNMFSLVPNYAQSMSVQQHKMPLIHPPQQNTCITQQNTSAHKTIMIKGMIIKPFNHIYINHSLEAAVNSTRAGQKTQY